MVGRSNWLIPLRLRLFIDLIMSIFFVIAVRILNKKYESRCKGPIGLVQKLAFSGFEERCEIMDAMLAGLPILGIFLVGVEAWEIYQFYLR